MAPSGDAAKSPATMTDLLTAAPSGGVSETPVSWEDYAFGPGGIGGQQLPEYSQPTAGDASAVRLDPVTVTAMGGDLEQIGVNLSGIHVAEVLGIGGALSSSDTEGACGAIHGVIESTLGVYAEAVHSLGVSVNEAADAYVATDDANAFRLSGEMRW